MNRGLLIIGLGRRENEPGAPLPQVAIAPAEKIMGDLEMALVDGDFHRRLAVAVFLVYVGAGEKATLVAGSGERRTTQAASARDVGREDKGGVISL